MDRWDRSKKESQFRSLAERQPIGVPCLFPAEISKTVSFAVWLTIVSLAGPLSGSFTSLFGSLREVYLAMIACLRC